jgi:hypothetical protein
MTTQSTASSQQSGRSGDAAGRLIKKAVLFHPPDPEAPRRFVPRSAAAMREQSLVKGASRAPGWAGDKSDFLISLLGGVG